MLTLRVVRAAAFVLLLSALCLPARAGREAALTQAAQGDGAQASVVFAVKKYDESNVVIDPVVMVTRGRLAQPPGGVANDGTPQAQSAEAEFVRGFYRPGRQFRVLFGGKEAGTVKVLKFEEQGCTGMVASATLQTDARLGGKVEALATDSATLGRGTNTRRAPTPEERAAAIALARKIFGEKRVPQRAIEKLEVDNLTAVDTDADGRHELVGSFVIMGQWGVEHAVFLVAEPKGAGLAPTLSWYHRGQEADAAARRLVDVLDLDGDGAAEIIAQGLYYESHDYMIYKKQRGAWREVYTGGGGGC